MNHKKLMLVLFITVFIDVIGIGIIIPLLPFYAKYFGASPTVITLLFSCFSLMQFLCSPFWGALSDRIGRKPIILISIMGSGLSYLWCGLATSLWMLFASRLLAGFMGGTIVTTQAYISDITTPENRAKGLGMLGAAFGLGFTFGPAMGGILAGSSTAQVNYQLPLLVASGLSLLGFIFAFLSLPKSPNNQHIFSEKNVNYQSSSESPTVSKLPIFQAFVRQISDFLRTFQLPLINLFIGVLLILGVALVGVQTILALWLESQFNWGPQQVGYLLMFAGVVATFFQGGMIGFLNKKFGEVNLLIAGLILLIIGAFLFPLSQGLILMLVSMAFLVIGESSAKTMIRSILSQLAQSNQTGRLLGIGQSATSLGVIIGPNLAGFAFVTMGESSPFFGSALLVFIVMILCLLSLSKIRLQLKAQ